MWRGRYLIMPNPCILCSASCCTDLYITVTIFDVLRISKKTGKKPEDFATLYPLRLINFDNDTVLEFHDRKYMEEHILCLKSHPCIFLDGKKCSIHGFSPSACGSFPKGIDGKYRTRLCPFPAGLVFRVLGTDVRNTYEWELGTYKKIVSEWNRRKGKKNDCMDFLLARAEEELGKDHSFKEGAGSGSLSTTCATASSAMK